MTDTDGLLDYDKYLPALLRDAHRLISEGKPLPMRELARLALEAGTVIETLRAKLAELQEQRDEARDLADSTLNDRFAVEAERDQAVARCAELEAALTTP